MSLSPTESADDLARHANRPFMVNQARLYEFIRKGKSFSGHERNCCFLNLDGRQFANVSAVSGFDLPDDARGMALVDWDYDGDQDVWLTNRNGPRVRFLRNDTPLAHHFLTVQLQGTTCNRDAIGSRVEVVLGNDASTKYVQSLRAGEGFLGQSSKRLHFGLGEHSESVNVIMHWPGGTSETFRGLAADGHYRLVQGSGTGQPVPVRNQSHSLLAGTPALPSQSETVRAALVRALPMPILHYQSWRGERTSLAMETSRPMLVHLWASWCDTCLEELAELIRRRRELDDAQLDVLALVVADRSNDDVTDPDAARTILDRMGFPFASGVAPVQFLDQLQLIHDQLFGLHTPLPAPTSLLLDRSGRLVAVYKGKVSVDQLLADVRTLAPPRPSTQPVSPFAGRWVRPPFYNLAFLASKFIEQDYVDDALDYIRSNQSLFSRDTNYAVVQGQLGWKQLDRDRPAEAESHFRAAIAISPKNADLLRGLAESLIVRNRSAEALEQLRRAVDIEPRHTAANLDLAELLRKTGRLDEAIEYYQRVIAFDPRNAEVHQNIGVTYFSSGKLTEAISHFRASLAIHSESAEVHKNLGLALAATGRKPDAIQHLEHSLKLRPGDAGVHNNLGSLLVASGDLDGGLKHIAAAVELEPRNDKYRRNLTRLQALRQRR